MEEHDVDDDEIMKLGDDVDDDDDDDDNDEEFDIEPTRIDGLMRARRVNTNTNTTNDNDNTTINMTSSTNFWDHEPTKDEIWQVRTIDMFYFNDNDDAKIII